MLTTKDKALFWIAGSLLFLGFLYLVSDILLPFVVGIMAAYFLDPAADKLEKAGLSRTAATSVITITFFIITITACAILIPVLYEQFMKLAHNIPDYTRSLQERYGPSIKEFIEKIDPNALEKAEAAASDLSGYLIKFAGNMAASLWQSGMAMLNLISLIFISPVVSFYMLRDYDRMVEKIDDLLPRDSVKTVREQMRLIDETLSGWIRGQTNVCLLLGIFYAVGLSLVGLEFGLFIGLATGLLSFIPYVGLMIGMATGIAVAFFQFGLDFQNLGLVIAVFVVGQVLEGNFITPKLVGEKVGLHAVWVMFGLLAGGALFGFTGILLAVPITAIIGVLTRFALQEYKKGSLYKGKVG